MSFVVPNGLSPDLAALTEMMAVALHAVRRSEIGKGDVAIVVGCGPVGLAVICHLKARGVRTVVASDFSPGRRLLASRCGADVVVDPAVDSPYARAAATKGVHHQRSRPVRAGDEVDGEAAQAAGMGTRLPRGGRARRGRPETAGHLRMRRRAGDDRRHHRRSTAELPRRRGRSLHGRGQAAARDGDQQGGRHAVRIRLHATGVPGHAAHVGRRQGGRLAAASPARSDSTVSQRLSSCSATPSRMRRCSSTRAAPPSLPDRRVPPHGSGSGRRRSGWW